MNYKFKTKPYAHQITALEKSWNKEVYAYFMEMGTGKSKVLIDNIAMLYDAGKINGVLIEFASTVFVSQYGRDPMAITNLEGNVQATVGNQKSTLKPGQQLQIDQTWDVLRANTQSFAEWVGDSRWRPVRLHSSLRSGIVRLLPSRQASRPVGSLLRQTLAKTGVVATAYDDGVLRFSMPRSYLWLSQLSEVIRALHHTLN